MRVSCALRAPLRRFTGRRAAAPSAPVSVASPARRHATLPTQRVFSPTPVIHTTLIDAHIHASCLLDDLLHEQPPTSLAEYVDLVREWWGLVEKLVQLPLDGEDIRDLPQVLRELLLKEGAERHHAEPSPAGATEEEADQLAKWTEWVWSSLPRTVPAAASITDDIAGAVEAERPNSADAATPRRQTMSYPQLTSLLFSYGRYHRGVLWGVSRSKGDAEEKDGAAAASYYRRRYFLHPWHSLDCPEEGTQQMPYVHVLQWMLADKKEQSSSSNTEASATLWSRHRALAPFEPTATPSSPFRALDVCTQSGYVTDLLLKAGAGVVVAADATAAALGNAESTYHEHLRENRSKRRDQVLLACRCDGLPAPLQNTEGRDATGHPPTNAQHHASASDVAATSASAAARRRKQARHAGRGYSGGEPVSSPSQPPPDHPDSASNGSPFHVVYIHPPVPSSVWPVKAVHPSTLHRMPWWSQLLRRAEAAGVAPHVTLPFMPCTAAPSAAEGRSPLSTLSGLRRAIDSLRRDVTERGVGADTVERPLLTENGYVVLVLPRTFEAESLLRGELDGCPSLADWAIAQLDGYYDLILRRRCSTYEGADASLPSSQTLATCDRALLSHLRHHGEHQQQQQQHPQTRRRHGGKEKETTLPHTEEWRKQLATLYQKEWWQDVLVFRKNAAMAQQQSAAHRAEASGLRSVAQLQRAVAASAAVRMPPVEWEDSFEYNEYHPREAASLTSHHWTDLMPTYSYLEDDFYDTPSVQGNFLAVGHQPTARHLARLSDRADASHSSTAQLPGVAAASAQAAASFHTIFAQELRTRRRSKLRKLALSPLERQEWYIDEKLIKSSGAKVELMNELAKWDLKDYDK